MSMSQNEATQSLDRTMIAPAANGNATLMGATVKCPVCGIESPPGEKYCADCGFLLSTAPGETAQPVDTSAMAVLVEAIAQREHFLKQGENTVGREGTDVLLADPTVSRRHALIIWDGAKVWVEDAGSTNGTFVGGGQVRPRERVELTDGVDLKFGSTGLTLKLPAATAVEAPTSEPVPADEGEAPADDAVAVAVEAPAPISIEKEAVTVAPEPATAPVAWLDSIADPTSRFPVAPGLNTIGRRPTNNIVLTGDSYVSGAHAELVADGEGFSFTDVGSTNGSVLNGMKLEPGVRMSLADGDHIAMGQTAVMFRIERGQDSGVGA